MISCFRGKFQLTSPRGYRTLWGTNQFHGGLDLVGLENTNVYAISDGKIDATPYEENGFGYYVRQLLPDGRRIYYGHLTKDGICVKVGQEVKIGERLGVMGSTGASTGAHTHIELRVPGRTKDSLDICEFTGIPNECGIYEMSNDEVVQSVCGLEDKTIDYMRRYRWANDLFRKIATNLK